MPLMLPVLLMISLATAQMPPPQPGPEHKVLTQDAGTWDAVIEVNAEPGKPPMTSKGVEVNTVGCGGLCLISDLKSDMGGAPYHGHGVTIWDASKKKYTGIWVDSMSAGISMGESTYDAKRKRFEGTIDGPGPGGATTKMRTVGEMPNDRTRVFTMYMAGPGGEQQMMKITYTKRQ